MKTSGKTVKPEQKTGVHHWHHYVDHPTWTTHVMCQTCGISIPRRLLTYAVEHGATKGESTKGE